MNLIDNKDIPHQLPINQHDDTVKLDRRTAPHRVHAAGSG